MVFVISKRKSCGVEHMLWVAKCGWVAGVGQNYDDDGDDDADGKTFNVDIKGVALPVEWVNSRGEER